MSSPLGSRRRSRCAPGARTAVTPLAPKRPPRERARRTNFACDHHLPRRDPRAQRHPRTVRDGRHQVTWPTKDDRTRVPAGNLLAPAPWIARGSAKSIPLMTPARSPNASPVAHPVLVLLSGGLDSAACMTFYRSQGYDVSGLFVAYGQSALRQELIAARRIAKHARVPLAIIQISGLGPFGAGFVPARN